MKVTSLILAGLAALPMTAIGQETLFGSPNKLIGDFDANSPGAEIAVPRLTFIDSNNNEYDERWLLKFNIFSYETGKKVSETPSRSIRRADDSDCSIIDEDEGVKYFNLTNSKSNERISVSGEFQLECITEDENGDFDYQELKQVFVYSTDLSSGTSWKYQPPENQTLLSVGYVDIDKDNIDDHLGLMLEIPTNKGADSKYMAFDISTGKVLKANRFPLISK